MGFPLMGVVAIGLDPIPFGLNPTRGETNKKYETEYIQKHWTEQGAVAFGGGPV